MSLSRTTLKRKSAKKRKFEKELDAVTPALVERCGGRCELADIVLVPGCSFTFCRHHRLRRSHGGGNELENLLLLCDTHHMWVHANPTLSYSRGWLVRGVS